jgi:hypothetical protein
MGLNDSNGTAQQSVMNKFVESLSWPKELGGLRDEDSQMACAKPIVYEIDEDGKRNNIESGCDPAVDVDNLHAFPWRRLSRSFWRHHVEGASPVSSDVGSNSVSAILLDGSRTFEWDAPCIESPALVPNRFRVATHLRPTDSQSAGVPRLKNSLVKLACGWR